MEDEEEEDQERKEKRRKKKGTGRGGGKNKSRRTEGKNKLKEKNLIHYRKSQSHFAYDPRHLHKGLDNSEIHIHRIFESILAFMKFMFHKKK